MSKYVFTDAKRTKKLYAKDCNISHRDILYYCPTPGCLARLTIRSLTGDINPYFAALKSHPHNESICSGGRTQSASTEYITSNFSIESLYDSVISRKRTDPNSSSKKSNFSNNESNSEEITTTSKLYYYCKGHDIDHVVNHTIKIRDLIADSRTNFIFTKGIKGLRLVESKFYQYYDSDMLLNVIYSVNPSDNNHHKLTLKFENLDDYSRTKGKLFTNTKAYSSLFIVILGDWNNNTCIIKHWKQVVLI